MQSPVICSMVKGAHTMRTTLFGWRLLTGAIAASSITSALAAQAPARDAPPAAQQQHAITFYSAGLEGILVDPKDKGLAEALRLIDERVFELPGELDQPIPAPP